jgi:DNA-binding beta-propeller fold protein YncE
MRRLLLIGLLAACGLATTGTPAQACFDCGAGVGPLAGGTGASVPSTGIRYVALAGARTTVVALDGSGAAIRWSVLRGEWGTPQVADDGTSGGVSGDGRVLVLQQISHTYPQQTTRFAVLRTAGLHLWRTIALAGDFSYDAISPSGSRIYLIEHPRSGLSAYRVRAYSVAQHRLLPRPITDPTKWGTVMHGTALTRVSSRDGSRAYTLYDEGNGHMFIHALDTVRGKAVCIDLPHVSAGATIGLELPPGDARLLVTRDGRPLRTIDTAGYVMSAPARERAATGTGAARLPDQARGGGVPVAALAVAVLALAAAAALVRGRGRLPVWRPRSD